MTERWRRVLALGAIAAALSLPTGGAPAAAQARPTLVASPTTQLHEGSDVHLSTEGWPEGVPGSEQPLLVTTCREVAEPDLERDCVVGPSRTDVPVWSEFEAASQHIHSNVDTTRVHRYLPLPTGLHDCRTSPCTLSLVYEGLMSDRVPLSFGSEWEPWGSPDQFVDEVLAPLPRRPVGPAEHDDLVAELVAGETPNREMVLRMVREPQVDASVGEATRQYVAFFGRPPDTGGLRYWADRLQGGLAGDRMARLFGASAEARATYAGMTPDQIVDHLYATALERPAEPDGRAYWIGRLRSGLPLWKLVWHVARSSEHRALWADEALATALRLGWQGVGPHDTAWVMGGEMYAWVSLFDGDGPPGL
ncbi:DUF4214 domain-containing protein [Iamia sp. SCSIO 61187]|uniref:DUF4214 domain-containing protein n=1 Tax=Iamia sp. SCSIO 61187 TaxID=2722752 RepID=UPI001C635396|nr:DUF4214 domain-containing protein [Iamia sp. SCSIO 61187]QYG94114.1 DUF4214 domain-containing protein [Iamia sp. SCSIO 61187]